MAKRPKPLSQSHSEPVSNPEPPADISPATAPDTVVVQSGSARLSLVVEVAPDTDPKAFLHRMDALAKQMALPLECIVVEHGGKQNEWNQALTAFSSSKTTFNLLVSPGPLGSGAALRQGVEQASGSHILTLDRQAAAQPEELAAWLHAATLPEYAVWCGSRMDNPGASRLQRWWWSFWNFVVRFFTSLDLRDAHSGIYLFPAPIAKALFAGAPSDIHYRTAVLYRAHLHDVPLEERPIAQALPGAWTSWRKLPGFKWATFRSAWGAWLRHYFVPARPAAGLPAAETPAFRYAFAYLMLALLFVMPWLSRDYGMTGDEHVQRVYGELVLDYYESSGEDDRAFSYKDLYNYGGLFDYWAAWFNRYIFGGEASGNMYQGRHLLNSLAGWFLFLFIGLLARLVSRRWSVAFWAALFALCSPRLFGDAMNNPKDIPFAAAYIFTLFHILRFVQQLPRPSLKTGLWIALGIAAAINIRIGGLLLIAYFGIFAGLAFLLRSDLRRLLLQPLTLLRIALIGVAVSALGFWLGTAYWPYAALDPFRTPFDVLKKMSDYYIGIRIMFNGESIWSDTVPWNYIPIWLLYTSPLFVLGGLLLMPLMTLLRLRQSQVLLLFLTAFAGIFPIAYVIYLQSGLYDGMRHTLFAYSTFPVLAAWAWWQIPRLLGDHKIARWALSGVLVFMLALPASFMVRNHPYQYVYFNELIGGVPGAYDKFDVDYWMTSMRRLSNWLIENEPRIRSGEKMVVATNCYEPVAYYFKYAEYQDKVAKGYDKDYPYFADNFWQQRLWNVEVIYTRYHERERHEWDYGIFYPRFIDREFLANGAFPPAEVVHAEKVDGIPIGVVTKRLVPAGGEAYQAFTARDFDRAAELYETVVKADPKNESGWLFLLQTYANKGDMPNMKRCVDELFALSDRYGTGYGWMGTYYLNINNLDSAQWAFERAIEYDYKYTLPYFQLARIYTQPGRENYKKALDYLEKFDEYGGKPQEGYDLAIQIATADNDRLRLQYFTAKKAGLTNFNEAYNGLKATLQIDRNYKPAVEAKKLYDELLNKQRASLTRYKDGQRRAQKSKDQVRSAYFAAKQMQAEGRGKEAYDALVKVVQMDSTYRPARLAKRELGKELKLEN